MNAKQQARKITDGALVNHINNLSALQNAGVADANDWDLLQAMKAEQARRAAAL